MTPDRPLLRWVRDLPPAPRQQLHALLAACRAGLDGAAPLDTATDRLLDEVLVVTALLQVPAPRRPDLAGLDQLADVVASAQGVDELARPLLDALHDLTGLSATYLTVIDEEAGQQHIRVARNQRQDFAIPEGLSVPWVDTLCRRSLEEGRACTTDVPAVWGDSDAARALGIQVYASVPVQLPDGQVWGTLCGADDRPVADVEDHLPTLRLFAKLIAGEVQREATVTQERQRAEAATAEALVDPLTGCASRRAVQPWLDETADLPTDQALLAAFADLDDFKQLNDRWGHAAGDAALVAVGEHLRSLSRGGDLVARLGGDEFLVLARVPLRSADRLAERWRSADAVDVRLDTDAGPTDCTVRMSIGVALSGATDAATLIENADREMYRAKRGPR